MPRGQLFRSGFPGSGGSAWIFCNVRARDGQQASAMVVSDNCGNLPSDRSEKQKNIQTPPKKNKKKGPRLCKHYGERDHQEKLNLSPQRAVSC
jgi:hypothetical protein